MIHHILPTLFVAVLLSVVIIFAVYVKYKALTNRFWTAQPCFHFFDIHFYLSTPAVISDELPTTNKYCDFIDVQTFPYKELSDVQKEEMVGFLQKNYDHLHVQSKDRILPFFEGFSRKNNQPIVSFFRKAQHNVIDDDDDDDEEKKKKKGRITHVSSSIIATMTSRTMLFYANARYVADIYYVDFLCVDKFNRKSGVAPKIIQTHEYNQRHANKDIKISLFKREGELTFIVPLCAFKTHVYKVMLSNKVWEERRENQRFIRVTLTNLHVWQHCIHEQLLASIKFKVMMINDMGNIMELIKSENIWMFMVVDDCDAMSGFYVFRLCSDPEKEKEKEKEGGIDSGSVSCIASVNFDTTTIDIFMWGFFNCLKWIQDKVYTESGWMLQMEEISDNAVLLEELSNDNESFRFLQTIPCAYFFYNYAMPPILPNEAFLMVT